MKKKKLTARRVNAIIASALAVTLAIPSAAFFGNANVTNAADETDEISSPIEAQKDVGS